MGLSQSLSAEEIENLAAEFFSIIPENYIDVGIEDSLLRYSGTDSTAHLVRFSLGLQEMEKAAEVLGNLSPVPNAVGLGAFIISMILRRVCDSRGLQDPDPVDALHSVFAKEKSSTVRDLVVEYLKRYEMHLHDDHSLLEDSVQLEAKLSLQITMLRNSILEDRQMSSRAVKHWINGVAFHVQVLLHIARLRKRVGEGTSNFESAKRAAGRAVDIYHRDMKEIMEHYKMYKLSTFRLVKICFTVDDTMVEFSETDIKYRTWMDEKFCKITPDDYLNYIFSNHKHLREIEDYFSFLKENLDVLANEEGTFQMAMGKKFK